MPCGHNGRFDQTWTSRTSPIAPAQISSQVRQASSLVLGDAVTWVATPDSLAARITVRHSSMERVSGLTQQVCFFRRNDSMQTTACVWSGVPIKTASISASMA